MDRRAAVLAARSGVLVAAGVYAATHRPTPGQEAAQAIQQGLGGTQTAEAPEDERF